MAKAKNDKGEYVSRAGHKLKYAIDGFGIKFKDKTIADLGSSTGGFVDVAIKEGAKKVYSVDTAYGQLEWNLRNNGKVVVMERQNALHIELPELVDIVTIDVGWTPQIKIIPHALGLLKEKGIIISLLKLHYEASNYKYRLFKGKVKEEDTDSILRRVKNELEEKGINITKIIKSSVTGSKGGNIEYLILINKYG